MGASTAFLTHAYFKNPSFYRGLFMPGWAAITSLMLYGAFCDDKAALAGIGAGFGAVLLAL